ncbi:MAG TPA: hypothetical protein VIW68_12960 [Candidatus Sulfotelmatobacter sp.]
MFGLLIARNVPLDFHKTLLLHRPTISAVSNHDQKMRFDFNESQWSAPASVFLPFPPAAESASSTPSLQLLSALQAKGFHYNRPPPAS